MEMRESFPRQVDKKSLGKKNLLANPVILKCKLWE